MDAAVGASGIEAGAWDGKIVPAVSYSGYCSCVFGNRHPSGQTVRGSEEHAVMGLLRMVCRSKKDAGLLGKM